MYKIKGRVLSKIKGNSIKDSLTFTIILERHHQKLTFLKTTRHVVCEHRGRFRLKIHT